MYYSATICHFHFFGNLYANMLMGVDTFYIYFRAIVAQSLVCLSSDNRWVLVGITSYGSSSCLYPGHFTVFTKVKEFSSWISAKVSG